MSFTDDPDAYSIDDYYFYTLTTFTEGAKLARDPSKLDEAERILSASLIAGALLNAYKDLDETHAQEVFAEALNECVQLPDFEKYCGRSEVAVNE